MNSYNNQPNFEADLAKFFNEFKNVPKISKKEYGSLLNNLKKDVLNKINSLKLRPNFFLIFIISGLY